jgi:hypothetical protein
MFPILHSKRVLSIDFILRNSMMRS